MTKTNMIVGSTISVSLLLIAGALWVRTIAPPVPLVKTVPQIVCMRGGFPTLVEEGEGIVFGSFNGGDVHYRYKDLLLLYKPAPQEQCVYRPAATADQLLTPRLEQSE
jgi:hypothetical protein